MPRPRRKRREAAERSLLDSYARSWARVARGRYSTVDLNRAKNWGALARLRVS
jgi:hypothetical protein